MYDERIVSPTRRYVAIVERRTKDNKVYHHFDKFKIPQELENTQGNAQWYYLNRINFTDVIVDTISREEYENKVH